MKRCERQEVILQAVRERGSIYLSRALALTDASEPTIRRDFQELEKRGDVERFHGGIRIRKKEGDLSFEARKGDKQNEKQAIARAATSLLKDGDVIFIDGGSTTFSMANYFPPVSLRIITDSLRLVSFLEQPSNRNPLWEIYLTGGCLKSEASLLTGPGTVHSLNLYHANHAFLSVGGLTDSGLYNTSEFVVETERKMIDRADHVTILADASKLGKRSMCHVCDLSPIHLLITNEMPDNKKIVQSIRKKGLEVMIVEGE